MTGWISGIMMAVQGKVEEVHYWPPPDFNRTYVTLDEILEDDVTEIEFHVTKEGLIVNVTDMSGEIVGSSSEPFEDIIARLTGVSDE